MMNQIKADKMSMIKKLRLRHGKQIEPALYCIIENYGTIFIQFERKEYLTK